VQCRRRRVALPELAQRPANRITWSS